MHHVKYKGCAKGLDKAHPQAIDLRRRGLNAEDGAAGAGVMSRYSEHKRWLSRCIIRAPKPNDLFGDAPA